MNNNYLSPYLDKCRSSIIITDAFVKADSVINSNRHKKILCSISGGADSDIMLDIIYSVDKNHKVDYVWFDTGLEYNATKQHLSYLENRYNIVIRQEHAIKPIPLAVKECGYPFLSKYISTHIERLQKVDFQWEDEPFETLIKKYPNCKGSLKWWCNNNEISFKSKNGANENEGASAFDINRHRWLKEFLISNPPDFKISSQCCDWSKKKIVKKVVKDGNYDLSVVGVRKSEGGIRQYAYQNCYTINEGQVSYYRPLFWFTNDDKWDYEHIFNIVHSDCYRVYGFPRTGCACCPFAGWNNIVKERHQLKVYEPKLHKAVSNIFSVSHQYMKAYELFKKRMDNGNRKGLFF